MSKSDHDQVTTLKNELAKKRQELEDGFFGDGADRGMNIAHRIERRRDLKGHYQKVYSIDWAGSGTDFLVSASQDGKLIVWNANSTNKLNAIPLKSPWVMSCAYEKNRSELVASGGLDNICSVFRLNSDEVGTNMAPVKELEGHEGYISCCRFMDDTKIITSSGDSTCRLWDVEKSKCVYYFKEHGGDVIDVDAHPTDKNIFVSGSVDLQCKLWDTRQAKPAASTTQKPAGGGWRFRNYRFGDEEELEGDEVGSIMSYYGHDSDVNGVAFFPDGNAFGTGSDDATCRLFDLRCHQQVNVFKGTNILCGITSVAFSSSGRILFGGYDNNELCGWDVLQDPGTEGEGTQVLALRAHEQKVSCVAVHSEGYALATASWDSNIKIYA